MKIYTVGMRTKCGRYVERTVAAANHSDAAKKARTLFPEDVLLSTEAR